MVGSTLRMVWKHPFMLSVTMSSNSSGVVSTPVLPTGPEPPATFTRISMRPPYAALAALAASSHCFASVRSHGTMIASPPAACTAQATGSIALVSRPTRASRAPSAANASVIAAPIPLAGPVMTATRPLRFRSMEMSSRSSELLPVAFPGVEPGAVGLSPVGERPTYRIAPSTPRAMRPNTSEQLLRQVVGRRHEGRGEDLVHRWRARELGRVDQDVDRPIH